MHISIEKEAFLFLVRRYCGLHSRLRSKECVANTTISRWRGFSGWPKALLSYEKAIGHSFIPSADINNIADRVIRKVLIIIAWPRKT